MEDILENDSVFEFLDAVDTMQTYETSRNRPRIVRERPDYFRKYDEKDFFMRFRMRKETALFVLQLIEDDLEYPSNRNNCISPMNQLLIALRFYATGSYLLAVGDIAGVSVSSVSRVVKKVSAAICTLRQQFIKFPDSEADRRLLERDFYKIASFPNVIGTIDCTHVKIQSIGGEDAELFRNRKGYFSMNVQTVCSPNLEVMNVVARWPGSTHDSAIFYNSSLYRKFEAGTYGESCLLGDSGYPLKNYLLTPYLNPATQSQEKYNESQIKTRNSVERQYGVLKRRFPALALGLRLKLENAINVIIACCILHNICISAAEAVPPTEVTMPDLHQIIGEANFSTGQQQQNQYGIRREHLVQNYFQRF